MNSAIFMRVFGSESCRCFLNYFLMRKENFNDLFAQFGFPPKEVEKELLEGGNWKVLENEAGGEEQRETALSKSSASALSQKERAKLRYLMKDYVPAG